MYLGYKSEIQEKVQNVLCIYHSIIIQKVKYRKLLQKIYAYFGDYDGENRSVTEARKSVNAYK